MENDYSEKCIKIKAGNSFSENVVEKILGKTDQIDEGYYIIKETNDDFPKFFGRRAKHQ